MPQVAKIMRVLGEANITALGMLPKQFDLDLGIPVDGTSSAFESYIYAVLTHLFRCRGTLGWGCLR